ncbi:MAG: restriction endonuclease subunit S [Pirellulaceae bacterium]|nr:restriction endonuclease subunit S [Pirellulaceae bacterium]
MSSNGWPEVPLSEVAVPVQRSIAVEPGKNYRTLGVKWWGQGAYERQTIDGSQTAATALNEVRENDLIINKIWVRHGSVGVVTPDVAGCCGSNEFPTFEFRGDRILPRWMHWYSKTRDLWVKCDMLSQGTSGKNRIRPEKFLTITIPLPSLEEQQRIVARIDHLAAKIEEAQEQRRRMNADIDALAASLHASLSKDRRVRMDLLVELHEERVPVEASEQYPQVGIKGFGGGLFPKPALAGTDTTYRHFNRLDAGMLVLSQVKGWEGAIAVCPDELARYFASPEYRTFRCIKGACDPLYLDTVVRSAWFRHLLQKATHGQGARRERTRPERFLTLELPMPEIDDQRRAARILSRLAESEPLKSHAAAACDALLPSILDRAFRGAL